MMKYIDGISKSFDKVTESARSLISNDGQGDNFSREFETRNQMKDYVEDFLGKGYIVHSLSLSNGNSFSKKAEINILPRPFLDSDEAINQVEELYERMEELEGIKDFHWEYEDGYGCFDSHYVTFRLDPSLEDGTETVKIKCPNNRR